MAEWCADHLRDVEVGSPSTGDFKFITFLLYVFVSFLFKRILVCSLCDYPTDSLHFVQGTMHGWRSSGLEMSTTSNECAKLFDAALRQFVSWTDCKRLDGLEKTMEAMQAAESGAVLPRAFALGLEGIGTGIGARTNETFRKALQDLQADAAKHGNEREKLHAKAVQQFGEGKQSAAANTWEEILKKYPTDLMAIKFAHDTYFYLGDAKMIRDSVQAVLPKHKGTEPCYSYLHGMLAFGLEECEQYEEAEKEALKALEANRYDCWATHARAHVLEMQGRFDQGIKFLESTVEDWKVSWSTEVEICEIRHSPGTPPVIDWPRPPEGGAD
ncbi:hypothetical protein Y032_0224g2718 [Ancylostoma ceylanicum]|uniref:Tetratricopeptide repeat protein 38 n=1 Tax=Ancylostoma ceylanicum TaxID=53326 RepID=A0A016SIC0_9BILA|nr:hypothetical protein Y032_0224g2718 [Ancylostoma ceylanicum]